MSEFKWRQFKGEVILWAVRWYCRYGIVRELSYLKELRFVSVKRDKRWRIAAQGRDFLLGLVEAKGIMKPAMLDSRGEE